MTKHKRKNIYFTSDPHFNHEKILEFTKRPYYTVQEMNKDIIKKWNAKVRDCDTVYVLGDIAWDPKKHDNIISELNGTKILIRGNHDLKANQMLEMGFDFVVEEAVIMISGKRVRLSHYPYRYTWKQELEMFLRTPIRWLKGRIPRYQDRRPKDDGGWLLCGHCHSKEKQWGKSIHVGWDAWYDVVSMQKIENMINQYENKERLWKNIWKIIKR